MPMMSSLWRLPYFLYRIKGEKVLWAMSGDSKIFILLPVATPKNLESGEKVRAVTLSLKLKCAKITYF